MEAHLKRLTTACPDIDPELIGEHVSRLASRYFAVFSNDQQTRHVQELARLSAEQPVRLLVESFEDDTIGCTILAFDYPGEFALLAGILSSCGFNILTGEIFTYAAASANKQSKTSRKARRLTQNPLKRRRIIDYFRGRAEIGDSLSNWAGELEERLINTIRLLEQNSADASEDARHYVNELVARRLGELDLESARALYPMQIEIDNSREQNTFFKVSSEDTPLFLYAFAAALSLRHIIVERVSIHTEGSRIEDEFGLVNSAGNKITDQSLLDQIRLSALLTKQFTYFLGSAPDPFAALSRFDHMVDDILRMPEQGQWMDFLSNPRILQDLARILGASDFMWEDFIRLQYESLLPILETHAADTHYVEPMDTIGPRLDKALAKADSFEAKCDILNTFKDREIFQIDLDHILNPETDFRVLSLHLTALAEHVVRAAVQTVYNLLAAEYGRPQTVAGLPAMYAILGLGKLGGRALGYASDIELLFVYGDNGRTTGPDIIDNGEFFDRLVREVNRCIRAKQQGIFNIDLRLRPFGNDSPLACSLENFCRYYGQGGPAHAYERLALVRMRPIGGDPELGAQLERIRDDFIYVAKTIDIPQLRELRGKQYREKTKVGRLNAKFSPGALVDLEYDVQILQVIYGKDTEALRTPYIHEALQALQDQRVLEEREAESLTAAYTFFRRLINGLRMLRGSAEDLFLPPADSGEYDHLARRIGYRPGTDIQPGRQLHVDFETHSAEIRAFVDKHFGRDALPGPAVGNVADLILSPSVPVDLRHQILKEAGFRDADRAYINLRHLAADQEHAGLFARLAVLAFDILGRQPDPDMALNNWERFIRALPDPERHYHELLSQPRRADILLTIFAGSQFLSDTIINSPALLEWITQPENLHFKYGRETLGNDLRRMSEAQPEHDTWVRQLAFFRRREILRIGTRDLCLQLATETIMHDLSVLAEALVQAALERVWKELERKGRIPPELESPEAGFCIMALGKLGGQELNYSSDIDLMGLFAWETGNPVPAVLQDLYTTVMERTAADLAAHTEKGHAYRVDLRLRPYGKSGALVSSIPSLQTYYEDHASLWEIQALLKARPLAGSLKAGQTFLRQVHPLLIKGYAEQDIRESITGMRETSAKQQTRMQAEALDIKNGVGGLRDIEFMVQGLQLLHASSHPEILTGNTLEALERAGTAGIIPFETANTMREDYLFLRRVEHLLQILEDRQTHRLPSAPDKIAALGHRMQGRQVPPEEFLEEIAVRTARIRKTYLSYINVGE